MNFACIEFTTKTGTVWRHTSEKPNYLCNPQTEIDPTSFGCYTSALHGEHIPLTGLIYDTLDHPPSRLDRLRQDVRKKISGTFAPADLSPLERFDVLLVIYQSSNDTELVRFVERVRTELPTITVVSSSSPPFGRLREQWKDHPESVRRYQQFLNATQFNMNVCRATVPYYHHLSSTPSLYLPQPYPVEYAVAHVREYGHTKKEPVIYVAGDTVRPDIMTGHLVARELQRRHPDLTIRITKTPGFSLNTAFLDGARYEVVPFTPWKNQLRALADMRLVINTDLWWTRGRVPVDCAAAGTPCIGTTSDGQSELWPDLTVSHALNVDVLVRLGERLLSDTAMYEQVVAKAQRRLTNYNYEKTVDRFTRAVELARAGRLNEWRDPVWDGDTLNIPRST